MMGPKKKKQHLVNQPNQTLPNLAQPNVGRKESQRRKGELDSLGIILIKPKLYCI